jgi:hypothetical protein
MPPRESLRLERSQSGFDRVKHGIDFMFGISVFLDAEHVEVDVSRERDANDE